MGEAHPEAGEVPALLQREVGGAEVSGAFWSFMRWFCPLIPPLERWRTRHFLRILRQQYEEGGRLWRHGAEVVMNGSPEVSMRALVDLGLHEERMKVLARIIREMEEKVGA